jgi:uncharacterized protein YlxP (DUF503 family)
MPRARSSASSSRDGLEPAGFVSVLQIELHFPEAESLKARRSELAPVKAHLRQRVGASVAEVGHQDRWQRATLVAALVAGSALALEEAADRLEGWLDARFPHGARVDRMVTSLRDLEG